MGWPRRTLAVLWSIVEWPWDALRYKRRPSTHVLASSCDLCGRRIFLADFPPERGPWRRLRRWALSQRVFWPGVWTHRDGDDAHAPTPDTVRRCWIEPRIADYPWPEPWT